MIPRIIDGKAAAQKLRTQYVARIKALRARAGVTPGLAVILVGDNPASAIYVNNKVRACASVGVRSIRHSLPATTDTESLVRLIEQLNADKDVHGILVQLPLPPHIDMRRVLESISVDKDVDGFQLQRRRSGRRGFFRRARRSAS